MSATAGESDAVVSEIEPVGKRARIDPDEQPSAVAGAARTRAYSDGGSSPPGAHQYQLSQQHRRKCPYLDTINRQLLDFDFEKLCSVTLTNMNVYAVSLTNCTYIV
jgi:hypothetical protein